VCNRRTVCRRADRTWAPDEPAMSKKSAKKKSGWESEEHRGNKIKTKRNRNMKTKDSTSWIFHWQPTRRTAVKSDRGKNQGGSEAKELIQKDKTCRWYLCSQLTSGGRSCAPRKRIHSAKWSQSTSKNHFRMLLRPRPNRKTPHELIQPQKT
jgi:hypothetical protein